MTENAAITPDFPDPNLAGDSFPTVETTDVVESMDLVHQAADQTLAPPARIRVRHRFRFRKLGDLRFIGHQDLLRCWDRAFRRAGVAVKLSEGFHPKPVFSSPLSLALGVEGLDEIVEFELDSPIDSESLISRITPELDAGLEIASASIHELKERAKVVAVEYRCPLLGRPTEPIQNRIAELLAAEHLVVERRTPNKPSKKMDLRPFILAMSASADVVELRAEVGDSGGIRPEEWLELLGLKELLDAGAFIVRTKVELASESADSPTAARTSSRQTQEKELA